MKPFIISQMRIFRANNSGIILFVVLWALVILTILAISLGRSTNIELLLTKNAIAKLQSKYLAWAGVSLALSQIAIDSNSDDWADKDTRYRCAIAGNIEHLQKIFEKNELGDGYCSLQFKEKSDGANKIQYGFEDEERKININALTPQNFSVLQNLITAAGVDEKLANEIAMNVVDWVDPDEISMKDQQTPEKDIYLSGDTGYLPKNRPFDSLEELMLVSKMDEDVFKKIKNYLTVFPKEGGFKINFDTASQPVLLALVKSQSGALTNTNEADAESLVDKMLRYRAGDDGVEITADDRVIDVNALGLNAKERTIFEVVNQYRTQKSNYIRVYVKGVVPNRSVTTNIDAVIMREGLSIAAWRRF